MLSHNYELASSFESKEFLDRKTFESPGPEGILQIWLYLLWL